MGTTRAWFGRVLLRTVLASGALMIAGCAATVRFHVAPDGDDRWTGRVERPNADRTDGPLASLAGARDAVRRWKGDGPPRNPVEVLIAGGDYSLASPVIFTPEDSGSERCPIFYRARVGEKPVFSGGRVLPPFQQGSTGLWVTQVPAVRAGKWYFEQLWVNGRRVVRARSPNRFYYYIQTAPDPSLNGASDRFCARTEDIAPLRLVPPDQLTDVNVVVYHSWEISRHRVAEIVPTSSTLLLTGPAPWPFSKWGQNQRYHLENFRKALDAPGEWFLDRDGTLFYKPLPGDQLSSTRAVAPMTGEFIRFEGRPKEGRCVEWIELEGLSFQHSQYLTAPEGDADPQAAVTVGAVIEADGARHVALRRCEIAHIGTYAVWFRQGCRDCRIEQCFLHDLGAGGVRIGDTSSKPDPGCETESITVENNILRGGGRIHLGAVGVWIGQSPDNRITHNDIGDFFYTGVSVGWTWGYGGSLARNNLIAHNHIHHLGWGVLSDMGGIYTLGVSPGTVLEHNRIHDVYSYDRYGAGSHGIYLDEGSTSITVRSNFAYATKGAVFHQHYGKGNLVENNIFALGRDAQLQRTRVEPHRSFTFRKNLVYWKEGELLSGKWDDAHVVLEKNLYWNAGNGGVSFGGKSLAEWQASGKDGGSEVADPLFVALEEGDFHLRPGSPVTAIGFEPLDAAGAGVSGNPEWVALAAGAKFPPLREALPPPPLDVADGFEHTPVGARPAYATAQEENRGDLIRVTDATAASGRRSLKITDAPGLEHVWNPHLVYTPDYRDGVGRCAFDLRIEQGAQLRHEWRDWDTNPYKVGPVFLIRQGKLSVAGRELLDIPEGQWVHVEVAAELGDQAKGRWTLRVGLPGQKVRNFPDLPTGHPDWKAVTWVGFVSSANEKTCYFLDNVRIRRTDAPGNQDSP